MAHHPEAHSATISAARVAAAIQRSGPLASSARVLIALSGGPDSTALLIALHEAGHQIIAAHYDHALRPDSAADGRHVAGLCDRLSIPLVTERRTAPLSRGSLQAAARQARYSFLERARSEADADVIATAHTLDDQLETILINLLRGTGLRGLAGIPATRSRIVRPLLGVSRTEVLAYLEARRIPYLTDPSNSDPRFLRVAVRHRLLPLLERDNPELRDRLERLAALAHDATDLLDRNLPAADRDRLQRAPAYARARALGLLYASAAFDGPPLRRRHLDALGALIDRWRPGTGYDLPRHVRVTLTPDRAVAARTNSRQMPPRRAPAYRIEAWLCPGCPTVGAVHLKPGRLELGYRRPGLRLRPPEAHGSRKLQDVLIDAKVPVADRDRLPLVFRNGQLAWVHGVATDVSHGIDRSRPGLHVEVRYDGSPISGR